MVQSVSKRTIVGYTGSTKPQPKRLSTVNSPGASINHVAPGYEPVARFRSPVGGMVGFTRLDPETDEPLEGLLRGTDVIEIYSNDEYEFFISVHSKLLSDGVLIEVND